MILYIVLIKKRSKNYIYQTLTQNLTNINIDNSKRSSNRNRDKDDLVQTVAVVAPAVVVLYFVGIKLKEQ
jgi:hypothetical protein